MHYYKKKKFNKCNPKVQNTHNIEPNYKTIKNLKNYTKYILQNKKVKMFPMVQNTHKIKPYHKTTEKS